MCAKFDGSGFSRSRDIGAAKFKMAGKLQYEIMTETILSFVGLISRL